MTTSKYPVVGILALQGDFERHAATFTALGIETQMIRQPKQIIDEDKEHEFLIDALVIPGGESTAIRIIAQTKDAEGNSIWDALHKWLASGRPTMATCAGLIIASELGFLPVRVTRNAYGTHRHSFEATVNGTGQAIAMGLPSETRAMFIRAPSIALGGRARRRAT